MKKKQTMLKFMYPLLSYIICFGKYVEWSLIIDYLWLKKRDILLDLWVANVKCILFVNESFRRIYILFYLLVLKHIIKHLT